MQFRETAPRVAIACGGTGGHLYPGLAVADRLVQSGCAVQLLISPKDVDQEGVRSVSGMEIVTLPAVGLRRGNPVAFLRGLWKSLRSARAAFERRKPNAVLAMGGFTSAAPIFVGRRIGAATFLHESNTIPGKASRVLAPWVDRVFVGFECAAQRLKNQRMSFTGTPVRAAIHTRDGATSRASLGFEPGQPLLLIMGGSQGASAINDLVLASLPSLASRLTNLQFLHVTGGRDFDRVISTYASRGLKAAVHPFLVDMGAALAAATAVISRAGASSLAEFAAMRLPAILIPFPSAADNHQLSNARALAETGAARLLEQSGATPKLLAAEVEELVTNTQRRDSIVSSLTQWHRPEAARQIVTEILAAVKQRGCRVGLRAEDGGRPQRSRDFGPERAEAQNLAAT